MPGHRPIAKDVLFYTTNREADGIAPWRFRVNENPHDRVGPPGFDLYAWLNRSPWLAMQTVHGTCVAFDQLNWIWAIPCPRTGRIQYYQGTARQAYVHCRYRKINLESVMPVPEAFIHGTCVREDWQNQDGEEDYTLVQSVTFHPWTWERPTEEELYGVQEVPGVPVHADRS